MHLSSLITWTALLTAGALGSPVENLEAQPLYKAVPIGRSVSESRSVLQTLQRRTTYCCGCYPNCNCPVKHTVCVCLSGGGGSAPCYPNCGCPVKGTSGVCASGYTCVPK